MTRDLNKKEGKTAMNLLFQNLSAIASGIPDTGEARTLWIVIPLLAISGAAVAAFMIYSAKKKKK